jgi:hypothetical protein
MFDRDFDVGITADEQAFLATLLVRRGNLVYIKGNLEVDLRPQVEAFVVQECDAEIDAVTKVAEIISKVVTNVLAKVKATTALVELCTHSPTNAYNVPRWHADGAAYDGAQYNIVVTLKGLGTLIGDYAELSTLDLYGGVDSPMDRFLVLNDDFTIKDQAKRRAMAKFIDPIKTFHAQTCMGNVLVIGKTPHSEPAITIPRLFLSIVPGTEVEIQSIHLASLG